jgi:hypothetical protein
MTSLDVTAIMTAGLGVVDAANNVQLSGFAALHKAWR